MYRDAFKYLVTSSEITLRFFAKPSAEGSLQWINSDGCVPLPYFTIKRCYVGTSAAAPLNAILVSNIVATGDLAVFDIAPLDLVTVVYHREPRKEVHMLYFCLLC